LKAKGVKGRIVIEFPSEDIARIIHEAVFYEHVSVPYRRSRISFERDKNKIILEIIATDSSAMRGTVNSYLRWIKVAMDAIDI